MLLDMCGYGLTDCGGECYWDRVSDVSSEVNERHLGALGDEIVIGREAL